MKDEMEVLRTLGRVMPPDGMEARLVARLDAREVDVRRGGIARVCWAGAAAAVVIAISVTVLHGRGGKMEQVRVPVVQQRMAGAVVARQDVGAPVRVRKRALMRRARDVAAGSLRSAPPLPLTEQERMLMALAQRPQLLPELTSIAKTETVTGNGVGGNSIFELASERLQPLQPLQPAPLGDLK